MDPQILNASLLPRNGISRFIRICADDANFHFLLAHNRSIVIQAPSVQSFEPEEPIEESLEMRRDTERELSRRDEEQLGHITLLGTIDLLSINWAYLIPQPDGQYRLIAERKQFYHISCTLWAPLIDESEIEITTYSSQSLRYGRWNGREVDIHVGWDDDSLQHLENETNVRRALRGLDLSFEVLGHLSRYGRVIGIVMEASQGRMIEYRDRAKMYAAVAKLLQNNMPQWGSITKSGIMVHHGKIRFVEDLHAIRIYSSTESKEMLEEASIWREEILEPMFQALAERPNPNIPERLAGVRYSPLAISPTPSPDRPLDIIYVAYGMEAGYCCYVRWYKSLEPSSKRGKKNKTPKDPNAFLSDWLHSVVAPYVEAGPRQQRITANPSAASSSSHHDSSHPYRPRHSTTDVSPPSQRISEEGSDNGASSITLLSESSIALHSDSAITLRSDSSRTLTDSPATVSTTLTE